MDGAKDQKDDDFFKVIDNSKFVDGDDNLAFDLSLQGCAIANEKFELSTYPDSYYLSIVTSKTVPLLGFLDKQRPIVQMNPLLQPFALYQGVEDPFDGTLIRPIAGWGAGDLNIDKWRENDGAVSSISQRFPFTAGIHPVGGERFFERAAGTIQKGKWYYENAEQIVGHRFDHFDVVVGSKINKFDPGIEDAQQKLYGKLCTFLHDL